MKPVKNYIAIAFVSVAVLIFVGLPIVSLGTVVHSVVFSQMSALHIAGWVHTIALIFLAYYFYDFFDWPSR